MKNILIIILSAAIGAIIIHYLLVAFGFNFDRGVVGGISGAIIGGWVSSYLNKKNWLKVKNAIIWYC